MIGWGYNKDGQLLKGSRILTFQTGSTNLGITISSSERVCASSFMTFIMKKNPIEDITESEEKEEAN